MAATAKVRTSSSLWLGKEEMQTEPTFAEINQVRPPFHSHHAPSETNLGRATPQPFLSRVPPQRIYDNIAIIVRESNALPNPGLHVFPVDPNYAEVFQMAK
jgi:hypothetical protein